MAPSDDDAPLNALASSGGVDANTSLTWPDDALQGQREGSASGGQRQDTTSEGQRQNTAPEGQRQGTAPGRQRQDTALGGLRQDTAPGGLRPDAAVEDQHQSPKALLPYLQNNR